MWNKKNEAKRIIKKNFYLSLATCSNNKPWICTLFYAIDKKFNLYFVSRKTSFHVQHLRKKPIVAFTIFDSHQKPGTGVGLQISGKVTKVKNKDFEKVIALLRKKGHPSENREIKHQTIITQDFLKKNSYEIFQIQPSKIYINDKYSKTDRRFLIRNLT